MDVQSPEDLPTRGGEMAVPSKGRAIILASVLVGLVSVILSFWMLGFFGVVLAHFLTTNISVTGGQSWRMFVFEITRVVPMTLMIAWVSIAGMAGAGGHWLAGRTPDRGRNSIRAMAARLSMGGLLGAGLDGLILVGMLGYRTFRLLAG